MQKKTITNDQQRRDADSKHTCDILDEIKAKLDSPVLNGGFETLMFNVQRIEEKQEIQGKKIDSIHNAIYEPDSGLYARIKDSARSEHVAHIETDVLSLKDWKSGEEKAEERLTVALGEHTKLFKEHGDMLRDISLWIKKANGVIKWLVLSIAGSALTIFCKVVYDFIQTHINYMP